MVIQLLVGSFVVALTIATAAVFMGVAIRLLKRAGPMLAKPPHMLKTIISLTGVTLWLLAAISLSVWIWAGAFLVLGLFSAVEPAVYFSIVSFTTLGFGDIILPVPWRLLSGICAANGLLLFGLSAAFLVEFVRGLIKAQEEHVKSRRKT